ncbi:o-succinylbenzoate synthase [bacterium]|nr:o-succinylbenzoate synthase [bacterium]
MEKIIDFNLYKYDLPLIMPLKIKNHELSSRSGIIINIKTSSGMSGFGETAPLPFFHKESFKEAVLQLKKIKNSILCHDAKGELTFRKITGDEFLNKKAVMHDNLKLLDLLNNFNNFFSVKFSFLNSIFSDEHIFPSVKSGIEMALLNMFFLNDDFKKYISSIEKNKLSVCKLITDLKPDICYDIDRIIKNGYNTIKIKVGRKPLSYEIDKIKEIKNFIEGSGHNDIRLRLDANGLWDLGKAVYFGKQIGSNGIEYMEDPMDDIGKCSIFFDQTNIPVAFDEKLNDFLKIYNTNKNYPAYLKAFVLKPGFIGDFSKISDLTATARERGIITVLSNSFESNISIAAIVLFACLMDLSDIPIGLDTMELFKNNLLARDIKVSDGKIRLEEVLKNIGNVNLDMLRLIE